MKSSSHYLPHSKSNRRAFTLVELMISLGIFAVVAVVALAALTKIVTANKKAQTLQAAVTNISFALESMSREMRTGKYYYCQIDNPSGTKNPPDTLSANGISAACLDRLQDANFSVVVAFQSTRVDTAPPTPCNLITAYRFVPHGPAGSKLYDLEKAEQTSCGVQIVGADYSPVLDPFLSVTGYHVKMIDAVYPEFFIHVSGFVGVKERDKTYFNVQTAVSARTQSI